MVLWKSSECGALGVRAVNSSLGSVGRENVLERQVDLIGATCHLADRAHRRRHHHRVAGSDAPLRSADHGLGVFQVNAC